MKIPPLVLGELVAKVPIIQGGMGVGVSRSRLASAVANEGGIGILSAAQMGFMESDFETDNLKANIRGMKKEIQKARTISPNGIIGINIMVAMSNYEELVKAALEEKIDLIISGAGLPMALPGLVKGSTTKVAPIVSSGKAAGVILKSWDKKYGFTPDLVVVEGPEAGGHLGFKPEELTGEEHPKLEDLIIDVIKAIKPFEEKYDKKIPVIAAGGIYTGEDIARFLKLGCSGVQIATRFVATEECDADINYKMAYINSKKEDITIIKSPVGLPGRAIKNNFINVVKEDRIPVKRCYNCLKTCEVKNTPYCISKALIEAVNGNVENGLIFSGSNAYKIEKIVTVKELIHELVEETEIALDKA